MKSHAFPWVIAAAVGSLSAHAAVLPAPTIAWNIWSSTTTGSIPTAGGPLAVSYSGETFGVAANYPSYTPTSSYTDGVVVTNAPAASNGILQLQGGDGTLNTVTFATPVVNPVMAIWSLGAGGTPASFVFTNATPVFVAGGPSAEYGGQAITVSGNTVSGQEGNGTVEFIGTYTSLSWSNPQAEYWYGFNVGISGVAAVPEAGTWSLMFAGLGAVAVRVRRSRTRSL